MMKHDLRKKEVKAFFKKVEPYISNKIQTMIKFQKWTGIEIYNQFGIPSNRQSEMKEPAKYPNGGLNEALMKKAIQGGLFTVAEIKKNVELIPREVTYLDTFTVHAEARAIEDAGFDPVKILQDFRKAHDIPDPE